MIQKYFKSALLIWLMGVFSIAAFGVESPPIHTQEKTIRKEFKVNPDALLKIQNSFGNLVLNSWDEDQVVIEVHIISKGQNAEKVARKLDEISIDFEANSSMVSAKTRFEKNNGWGWFKGNDKVQLQVNYTIKLPVKNSVSLHNDYGNITLDRIDGHAKISCDYGRLELGELRGRNNQLNFDYTTKSRIGYMNSGEIRADYSGFTLERAGSLTLQADYSAAEIGVIDNLDYACDYGNLDVREVKNLTGKGDYFSVNLGSIGDNAAIIANYGSLRIGNLGSDAKNINLTSEYTGITIGYREDQPFDFDINSEYANVRGKSGLSIQISQEKNNHSFYYNGYYSLANSGPMIKINSQYGSITFEKQ